MATTSTTLFLSVALLSVLAIGWSNAAGPVKCYQCNSDNKGQEDCATSDAEKLKPFIKPCTRLTEGTYKGKEATSCRKVLQNVVDDNNVVRECGYTGEEPIDGKRRIGNKAVIVYLYQCFNEDGSETPCNSAATLGMSLVTSLMSLFVVLFVLKV